MATVSGVSKEEPREVNEKGASQSRVLYRFDLLDPPAMFEMTKVLKEGADKYGVGNWRGIDVQDHLNHLLIHVYAYLAGDTSDDHLSHIMCRAMFAQAVDIDDRRMASGGADTDGDVHVADEPLLMCGQCHSNTLVPTQGVQHCFSCGCGQNVNVVKVGIETRYYIDPVHGPNECNCGSLPKSIYGKKFVDYMNVNNQTGGFKGGD